MTISYLANALPVPDAVKAGTGVGWFFTIWGGGIGLLALPWCVHRGFRDKNWLPTLMWFGGALAIVPEPLIDHVCYLWWPNDLPGPVLSGWDVNVPLFIPFAYAFFVGLDGYIGYVFMRRGISIKGVWMLFLVFIVSDLALEYPGVGLGAYEYYGSQPFQLGPLPLWVTWINATGMLLGAFILWLASPHLKGWNRLFVVMIPMLGYVTSWFTLAWPNYMALEWDPPIAVRFALSSLSLAFCLAVVAAIGRAVSSSRADGHSPIAESSAGATSHVSP
ncbi:hypothetical protein [Mycobacterium sp. E1747]|uniref:hypothetical protein n=1 Tax=Mycobacterium sp. E1747 TaxID=1834128 RepID=UPI0007FD407E|nr:hypothetical protein [Mycobacterium sp. E1747]OBH11105.1 hypothetical protein A5695_20055 [Mycobacterium sp. E1747]